MYVSSVLEFLRRNTYVQLLTMTSRNLMPHVCETRKFVMAILHFKHFLLFPPCFIPFLRTFRHFYQTKIIVCKVFQFGEVEKLPFGKGLMPLFKTFGPLIINVLNHIYFFFNFESNTTFDVLNIMVLLLANSRTPWRASLGRIFLWLAFKNPDQCQSDSF